MYRKFTADHIFNGHQILQEPSVLITDLTGTVIDMVDFETAGDGIEILKGLLTPGFVNAHCHLELSHLKGVIPEKTGLVDFVQQVMRSRASSGEMKLNAIMNAETEMYHSGVVAVGDICNTSDTIPLKQKSKLLWHNFIEVSGFVEDAAQRRLDEMRNVFAQFQLNCKKQVTTLSPHAPYSISKKLFHLLNEETSSQLITIHNQECAAENDLYQNKSGGFLSLYQNVGIDISKFFATGKSSLQSWLPWFTKRQSIISVHNTFTDEEDIVFSNDELYKNHQLFYCLCVNANKYIEQKLPPIDLLMKHNCNIVIGTDSYASNWQLNILEEIKTIQQETNNTIPLEKILIWATINGAKALQLDAVTGSFEKGKTPGIVLIENLNNLQTTARSFARRVL